MTNFMNSGAQFASAFPNMAQYIKGDRLAKLFFDQLDPRLSNALVVDPTQAGQAGGAPIEQQVQQMAQMMQQMMQALQPMQQYLTALAQHDANGETNGQAGKTGPGAPAPAPQA